jgi:hypothetical protein
MMFRDVSSLYLYGLLLSYKFGLDKVYDIYPIPRKLFEDIYSSFSGFMGDRDFRVDIVLELLDRGESPEKVAEAVDWRDFEYLVGRFFSENGYEVRYNYRLKSPRREIDVISIIDRRLFCIDCKNWDKVLSKGVEARLVTLQTERCRYLCKDVSFRGYDIYPLIVVMRRGSEVFLDGVGVIPISALKEFLQVVDALIMDGSLISLSC